MHTLFTHLAAVIPLALDGEGEVESSGGSGGTIALVSGASIVLGYVALFVLWRFVFSAKAKARRGEPPD